jgi:CheY-like chemotaxis protein
LSEKAGHRVLLVEDEAIIAMLVEDMLIDLGFTVMATAYSLEEALQAACSAEIDLAVLDVNLNGKASFPVADILCARQIPFIFATGYSTNGRQADFRNVPVLNKPFNTSRLAHAIETAQQRQA